QFPQATLNAQASTEAQHDTVRITLAAELSDVSQAPLNSALTKVIGDAMARAKTDPKVKASSGNYRVWPFHNEEGKITNWHGRGEIVLESQDFAAASQL